MIAVGMMDDKCKKNERWNDVLFICLAQARSGLWPTLLQFKEWPEHSGGGIPPEMELSYHRLIYGGGLPILAVWSKIVTSGMQQVLFPFSHGC